MRNKMKVLFLISYYKIGDGASNALNEFIRNSTFIDDYDILCRWKVSSDPDLHIKQFDEVDSITDYLRKKSFSCIHYFKTRNSDIFYRVVKSAMQVSLQIPVLTTVCQRPSFKSLLLSPFEIQHSSYIVLIDKASYNDSIIRFIPQERRKQIYFSGDPRLCEQTSGISFKRNENGPIIFGRGTSLSKCPLNMIDIFDRISISNKIFCIVGIPKGDNWVRRKAKGRNDIIIYDLLPYEEWLKVCATFDVCLYQIPVDSHASIDANLGLAMLMNKPVVYYGSEAPKERFIHGENGFIAETYDEIVKYATLLGKDEDLRKRIGVQARKTTVELIEGLNRKSQYAELYYNLKPALPCRIPLCYRFTYLLRCFRPLIRMILNWYPKVIIN